MVVHTCNPSTEASKAGEPGTEGQPLLCNSPCYVRQMVKIKSYAVKKQTPNYLMQSLIKQAQKAVNT